MPVKPGAATPAGGANRRLQPGARILVTGHGGFVGQTLLRWFPQSRWAGRAEWLLAPQGLDIRDRASLEAWVTEAQPDHVLHLAAQSFVPAAFRDPAETLAVNLGGTLNLLQALAHIGFAGRLLYVSSADVYGAVPAQAMPVTEERLPEPRNPYAVSKLAAETLCRQWHFSEGLDVVVARPFNHTGVGQDARFVLSGFAQHIARIAAGLQAPQLEVGNLEVTRDFSDVCDILDAYLALFDAGRPGEVYNVCSGVERRLSDVLAGMLAHAGVQARIVTDTARLRPNEQVRMVGDNHKLRHDTGWQPQCQFEETLAAMVAWWREKEETQ